MEERVRVCRACNAIVGWFAQFCESCGSKQEAVAPEAAKAAERPPLEVEARRELSAAAGDARAVARDLFQTQLRLIHRNREGVEDLIRDVEAIQRDLAGIERGALAGGAAALDGFSQRVFDAEQRWGELQVAYNRDSEVIEEEGREAMETADIEAYLSVDEREKVESEFETLAGRFETVDGLLRDVGRALALARQETSSRYLGGRGATGPFRGVLLVVTAALVGWSVYSALFRQKMDVPAAAETIGPLVFAVLLWVIFGFSRRA